jgi:hypothetical protein
MMLHPALHAQEMSSSEREIPPHQQLILNLNAHAWPATLMFQMLPLQQLNHLFVKNVEPVLKIVMLDNQLYVQMLQNKLQVKIVLQPLLLSQASSLILLLLHLKPVMLHARHVLVEMQQNVLPVPKLQ